MKCLKLAVLFVCLLVSGAVYAESKASCEDLDLSVLNAQPSEGATFTERMDLLKKKQEILNRQSECNRRGAGPTDEFEQVLTGGKYVDPGVLKSWLEKRKLVKHAMYRCPGGAYIAVYGPVDPATPYRTMPGNIYKADPTTQWWAISVSKPSEVKAEGVGSGSAITMGLTKRRKCVKEDVSNE